MIVSGKFSQPKTFSLTRKEPNNFGSSKAFPAGDAS